MDFDTSKENIQPLRGGRNVAQLGVALQAQTNQEYQRELQMQRAQFEEAIRMYDGDDPLENWYNFISWVEQSYPKHGHEGNLVPLLEDCLSKFEYDKRYKNDRRFCKLWIKYIDLQKNPLELLQMMHSGGLCRKCAEMYLAWAYYHEAVGDFYTANTVFEMGIAEVAQPYEELVTAHNSMIVAAGRQTISGSIDERRLAEQRQALTCLQSVRSGRVASIRTGSTVGGVVPSTTAVGQKSNVPVTVYEDTGDEARGQSAPSISILSIARKQDLPHKENTMKPGPWTTVPYPKHSSVRRVTPDFVVHEDDVWERDVRHYEGIRLPLNFASMNNDDFTNWQTILCHQDQDKEDNQIPMYPKQLVYSQAASNVEYSLEEVRSWRYYAIMKQENVRTETEQASYRKSNVENEMPVNVVDDGACTGEPSMTVSLDLWKGPALEGVGVCDEMPVLLTNMISDVPKFDILEDSLTAPCSNLVGNAMRTPLQYLGDEEVGETGSRSGFDNQLLVPPQQAMVPQKFIVFEDDDSDSCPPNTFNALNESCSTQIFNLNAMCVSTPQHRLPSMRQQSETIIKPSRKSLFPEEVEPNKLSVILEDTKEFRSSSTNGSSNSIKSVNTFSHSKPDPLSVINEASASYDTLQTTRNMTNPGQDAVLGNLWNTPIIVMPNTEPVQNWDTPSEYQFNLSQNLKANEALRLQLLGNDNSLKMECESVPSHKPPIRLNYVPTDPFSSIVLNNILQQIEFPTPLHTDRYQRMSFMPRVQRKETAKFGDKRYSIEKALAKGAYGSVYKAQDMDTNEFVALKLQKPPNRWEFYILSELRQRLRQNPLWECFMDVRVGYFTETASVLVSAFNPNGSLLDFVNNFNQRMGRSTNDLMPKYFALEMLKIVRALHQAQVIHADIKPDNWLVVIPPSNRPTLQLIDFGCSIDMALFPDGASFTRPVTTDSFVCPEMLEGKRWNYHTDIFCVAACTHMLLFNKYMEIHKINGAWCIKHKFQRYQRSDLWNTYFSTLLNLDAEKPSTDELCTFLEDVLAAQHDLLQGCWRDIANIVYKR